MSAQVRSRRDDKPISEARMWLFPHQRRIATSYDSHQVARPSIETELGFSYTRLLECTLDLATKNMRVRHRFEPDCENALKC